MGLRKDEVAVADRPPEPNWHIMEINAVVSTLKAPADVIKVGLTSEEAASRLAEYGPNQLTPGRKKTIWERIWDQINNILVLILFVVAIVSAVQAFTAKTSSDKITNWLQFLIIVAVVVINTYIGLVQEGAAQKAGEALKEMLSSDARVMRDGKEILIAATELVPGDLVLLGLGDKVPCDMRIITSANLACGEAALTGEPVPIDKVTEPMPVSEGRTPAQTPLGDRCNMAFSATLVAQGTGVGVCVTTGDFTQIGTINALVTQVDDKKTAILVQIDTISKVLAVFIITCAIITFLIAYLKTGESWIDALTISLVAAVAMVPAGLVSICTAVFAVGVSAMAKRSAIVRVLPAVETLGSVTVICSDKTGTLTQNQMSLTAFVTSNARYIVDVNASERSNANFIRDDSFLATRAEHQVGKKTSSVIRDGPNVKGTSTHGKTLNEFSIDSLNTPMPTAYAGKSASSRALVNELPVSPGESPSTEFIKSALAGGVLCSKCVLGVNGTKDGDIGNPTEISILRAAYFAGIDIDDLKTVATFVTEVPFSSGYKFMATVHHTVAEVDGPGLDDKYVVHAKGAPDRMIPLCKYQAKAGFVDSNMTEPIDSRYWIEQIAILSSHGLRVLALTRGTISKAEVSEGENLGPDFINGKGPWLTMVGLCAIIDPPRPECVEAIKLAHCAGVRVAMITGDHKDTAVAIGLMLGIVDEKFSEAVTGPEMDAMSDDELRKTVMSVNVFARASPENKIRIVKALQAEGQVASMTGDGVNDAPALKAADMGVAMGKEGTDVAREASEMILADDNFASIVAAVKEGRVVWENIRKAILINTAINNAQGLSVLFGYAFGLESTPLTAIQVLYSNLICATTLGFVCAVEPAEDGIMNVPPRRVGKRLIGRYIGLRIIIGTIILTGSVVASVFWVKDLGYDELQQRAQAFNVLDFGAVSITLSARFAYNSSFHPRVFQGNKYVNYSILFVMATQVFLTYVPYLNDVIFGMSGMDAIQWGICAFFTLIVFIVMECEKVVLRMLKAKHYDTSDQEEDFLDPKIEILPEGSVLVKQLPHPPRTPAPAASISEQ